MTHDGTARTARTKAGGGVSRVAGGAGLSTGQANADFGLIVFGAEKKSAGRAGRGPGAGGWARGAGRAQISFT